MVGCSLPASGHAILTCIEELRRFGRMDWADEDHRGIHLER